MTTSSASASKPTSSPVDGLAIASFLAYLVVGGFLVFGFAWALRGAIESQNDAICQAMLPEARTRISGSVAGASGGVVTLVSDTATPGAPTAAPIDERGAFRLHVPPGHHRLRVEGAGQEAHEIDVETLEGEVVDVEIGNDGALDVTGHAPLMAPELDLVDLEGNPVELSDFRGRLVVVNFWATWCKPCITEWPHVAQLAERLTGREDVVVLAVSVDTDKEAIAPFLAGMALQDTPVNVVWDAGQNQMAWGTEKIPDTYLVGPNGELLYAFVGPRQWGSPEAYHCVNGMIR